MDQDKEDYMNYLMLHGTQPESNPESTSHNRNLQQGKERYVARALPQSPVLMVVTLACHFVKLLTIVTHIGRRTTPALIRSSLGMVRA